MAMSDHKAKDAAMASYMKNHPGAFPDSVMRPWNGAGADIRKLANSMQGGSRGGNWERGMLGGVMCARLGLGSYGIPRELI